LCAIKHEVADSPIKWTFKWIEGHQDDHVAADQLDEWARANVQADTKAKPFD